MEKQHSRVDRENIECVATLIEPLRDCCIALLKCLSDESNCITERMAPQENYEICEYRKLNNARIW